MTGVKAHAWRRRSIGAGKSQLSSFRTTPLIRHSSLGFSSFTGFVLIRGCKTLAL